MITTDYFISKFCFSLQLKIFIKDFFNFFAVYSACDRNACQNSGTCRQHVLSYECKCPPGFSGVFCENSEYLNLAHIKLLNEWEH